MPVEPEDVEEGVGDRNVLAKAADRAFRLHVHAPLEPFEAGPAGLRVESHDLAVEDHLGDAEGSAQLPEFRVAMADVVAAAGLEADPPTGDGG
jgi:hypothetical protein